MPLGGWPIRSRLLHCVDDGPRETHSQHGLQHDYHTLHRSCHALNVVPFDRPLIQSNNYSHETILEWARNTVSKLELIGREDSKIMEVVNKM